MKRNQIRSARREVKVPRTRDESGGHDPSRCADDTQPLILSQNRAELEFEELGDIPDEGEDFSDTVVDGRHRREEVYDGFR